MNTALSTQPYAVVSVTQLTTRIRSLLEPAFDDVAVVGEISNFKPHSSGHWYFSLKDSGATLPSACFRQANIRVKFDPQDGLKVIARGRLEIYPPRGGYQLIINSLEPVGIGQWQLAFEQLKERLDKEGLLAAERKRPIPLMPRKIGIVTSPTAAALRDILTALKRRNRSVRVVIAPTRVQGDGVEQEIAQAIKDVQLVDDVEVIIVARGGGSIEDLWCFNTEPVARAVAACKVPVISGIGHETDVTICDLVADLRAPTPTAAAELVSRGQAELTDRWSALTRLLLIKTESRLALAHRSLERLNPRHALARQAERLKKIQIVVSGHKDRLERLTRFHIGENRHRWQRHHEQLHALSPLNTLNRGFAIVRRPDGSVIQEASQVQSGDTVEAWLRKGKLRLKVEQVIEEWYE